MTMTRQGWAEKVINRRMISSYEDIAAALKAEHRRAVRVVKREIADLEVIKSRSFCNAEIAEAYASITVLRDILAALQKGRTFKPHPTEERHE